MFLTRKVFGEEAKARGLGCPGRPRSEVELLNHEFTFAVVDALCEEDVINLNVNIFIFNFPFLSTISVIILYKYQGPVP